MPEDTDHSRGSTRVAVLTLLLAAGAAAVQILVLPRGGATGSELHIPWLVLLAACTVSQRVFVHIPFGPQTHTFALAEIPLIVGLAFGEPDLVILADVLGFALVLLSERQGPLKFTFNITSAWFQAVASAVVWALVLDGQPVDGPRGWFAVLCVALVIDVLSAALVTLAISLTAGRPVLSAFSEGVAAGTFEALANGSFGVVVVTVLAHDWRAVWALLGVMALLFVAYRSYASLQRRHDSLEQVADFTRVVDQDLRARAIAERVAQQVLELLRAEVVELVFWEGDDMLRVRAGGEVDGSHLAERLVTVASPPLLVPRGGGNGEVRAALAATGLRDAVVAPLLGGNGEVGTLLAANRLGDVDSFDAHDLTMLQSLANHASVALRNGRLADSLREQAAEREYEALHDGLTGLGNRRQFHERVAAQLAAEGRVAVLLLDLDRFKEVNDTLGHANGDLLLQEIGKRLRVAMPADAQVARLGGDEFVVAAAGLDQDGALRLATAARAALSEPFTLRGLPLQVDASIGIALAPEDGVEPELLLQRADVAMYAAKEARSGVERYDVARDQYSPRRLALMAELRQVVSAGALTLHYQPKAALEDGRVVGVEALVRWQHPQHGFIPPDEFVPLAEHTGLMRPLTLHVLGTAVQQCAAWHAAGLDLGVAVNLSTRSLNDPALVDDVVGLLTRYGLPAHLLTLEITESDILNEPERAIAVLDRLARLGVHRSVDDFGTGYSSLSYLNRLPVDEMKIDRSFVQAMRASDSAASIVATVADLGRRLGKRIVAEGVEDQWTWDALRDLGCDIAQGYLLSRPLPAEQLTAWLRAWAGRPTTDPLLAVSEAARGA